MGAIACLSSLTFQFLHRDVRPVTSGEVRMSASDRRTYLVRHPDPYPDRPVERAHHGRGVGCWVPEEKHRILADFTEATWGARKKWPHRVYLDLFSGPGRIQVEVEEDTRDGGSLIAWRQSSRIPAGQFTQVIVGDLDPDRSSACGERLRAAGANSTVLSGPAVETARQAVQLVPQRSSLCLAYLDPYSHCRAPAPRRQSCRQRHHLARRAGVQADEGGHLGPRGRRAQHRVHPVQQVGHRAR